KEKRKASTLRLGALARGLPSPWSRHTAMPFPLEPTIPGFPTARPRRLRHHPLIRELVRETTLSPPDLILPLFVRPGRGIKNEITSLPGNYQLSGERLHVEDRFDL